MATHPGDPGDRVLEKYVASCLERIGPNFTALDIVRETIADQRDLWVSLYNIDRGAFESVSAIDS